MKLPIIICFILFSQYTCANEKITFFRSPIEAPIEIDPEDDELDEPNEAPIDDYDIYLIAISFLTILYTSKKIKKISKTK